MSPPPPPLPALPAPGLALHSPSSIAHSQTILLLKESKGNWSSKAALTITQQGAPYLEAREEPRRTMIFRTPSGAEVLRVVKQVHRWTGRGEEYHGMRPDGSEAWRVKLHRGLRGTEYNLTVLPTLYEEQSMLVQNKVLGEDKGILWNGQVVATMSMHEQLKHVHRESLLNVAPGMDILLALGVCYVRYDKKKTDEMNSASVNSVTFVGAAST